jgi:PPOX class probable F420-dependent enzyme
MTDDEVQAFLRALPARTAKLATVRKDGRPHVAPIWVALDDDGCLWFNTGAGTLKGTAIRRDPRVSLCFDDERPPFSFVVVEGEALLVEDDELKLRWATTIGGRYMGEDQAEAYGRRNAVDGELLVKVTPTNVVAMKHIAE